MASIEVRVTGKGSVVDGQKNVDTNTKAACDLCQQETDVVASVSVAGGAPFACKDCLRQRLEAMTVSSWMLRENTNALPWGKVSG
jgi:hypothetical protein